MLHLLVAVTYELMVHFQMWPHATHEAPIGQQPVCRRELYGWAPQQTPGCVCEKARLQSFWKQQLSQPTETSWRGAATAVESGASEEASAERERRVIATAIPKREKEGFKRLCEPQFSLMYGPLWTV